MKVRSLKIKELRKTYGANVLADVLDNRFSESKKTELEDQVIEILKELNQDEDRYYFEFKGALSGLRQFLAAESSLKMMKNAFYFTSKALFVLKIFKFLS